MYHGIYKDMIVNLPTCKCIPYENSAICTKINPKYKELVESIGLFGIIIPVIVRKIDDNYEVVVGRLRLLALKELGIGTIPAIIRDLTDDEVKVWCKPGIGENT